MAKQIISFAIVAILSFLVKNYITQQNMLTKLLTNQNSSLAHAYVEKYIIWGASAKRVQNRCTFSGY
jgi:hypothetical protein